MSRQFVILTKGGDQVAEIDTNTFAKIMAGNRGEMQLVTTPAGRGVSAFVVNQPHSFQIGGTGLTTLDISIALDAGYRIYRSEDIF
ncbi:hypothetical protein [Xanthomonas phage X1]|nr:hypothetical protein [Xanthomonas phage X1]